MCSVALVTFQIGQRVSRARRRNQLSVELKDCSLAPSTAAEVRSSSVCMEDSS